MKKILSFIFSLSLIASLSSCTDDFEKTNQDPNKIYQVNIDYVFRGTVYKTLNCLAQLNYNEYLPYSRYVVILGNVNALTPGVSEPTVNTATTNFYVNILKDLDNLEKSYNGTTGFENRAQIVKTWKAYIYSIIASTWGAYPMSDALNVSGNKVYFNYDSEKEMYVQILSLLKEATDTFNTNASTVDVIKNDPLFPTSTTSGVSDIFKWRKFANTLRLDVALRMQNIDLELSKQAVSECMAHEDWFISSVDDIAKASWGTSLSDDASYYYNTILKTRTDANWTVHTYPRINQYFFLYLKSFNDPRLASFADPSLSTSQFVVKDTIERVNPANATKRDLVAVQYRIPYLPAPENLSLPSGWTVAIESGTAEYQNPYATGTVNKTWSYVNMNFIKTNAQMVLYNWADACFMKAEARIKFGVGSKTAEEYYNAGIDASFAQYGYSSANSLAYRTQSGVQWNTNGIGCPDYMYIYQANINGNGGDANHLDQIYKQWYIADYFNGFAGWTLERRTRAMQFPPHFYNGGVVIDGSNGKEDFTPQRLIYAPNEMATNSTAYYNGISILQANSSQPNNIRWGDNYYTTLQFALPETRNTADWESRKIIYNWKAVQKWYGSTENEFILNTQKTVNSSIVDASGLSTYIGYKVISVVKTY